MSDTPETLAAILAEMRDPCAPRAPSLPALADRIEAAAKRRCATLEDALSHCREYAKKIERENEEGETRLDAEEIIATVDNEFAGIRPEHAPGNAAAMREALTAFVDSIQWLCDGDERGIFKKQFAPLLSEARAALGAPPEPPSNAAAMREAILAIKEINDKRTHDAAGYEINDIIEEALATAKGSDHA